VAPLDALASQFSGASRVRLYEEASTLGQSIGDGTKYYLRVMEKLLSGTEDYVVKETKRLATILEKKTLASRKLDEIKIKINILAAFAEKGEVVTEDATENAKASSEHVKVEL